MTGSPPTRKAQRPKLLDLFCCEGGAATGYAAAGFAVTGVDIAEQINYPFRFVRGDALELLADAEFVGGFAAIHASPPCQASTTMSNRWRGAGGKADEWVSLIVPTREALERTGLPWVLENVPGARSEMVSPITLHGGMFGLRVDRPRLFDSNVLLMTPQARRTVDPLGVYGKAHDGRRLFTRKNGSNQYAAGSIEEARAAMGMPWASWNGCREAIPPAYCEFIGEQLLSHIVERVA